MKQVEFNGLVIECSNDILAILTSMQGLLLIAQYYPNHPTTEAHLQVIVACVSKIEACLKNAQQVATELDKNSKEN